LTVNKQQRLQLIHNSGIIAIMRANRSDQLMSAAEAVRTGAAALGVGSSLVHQALLDSGDLAELTRRAAAFIEAVKNGR